MRGHDSIPTRFSPWVSGFFTHLISWDPVLFDADNNSATADAEVDVYRVRLLNGVHQQFFRSAPFFGPSFNVAPGLITPVQAFIRLEAQQLDANRTVLLNRSSTFTQFTVPEPATLSLLGLTLTGLGFRYGKQAKTLTLHKLLVQDRFAASIAVFIAPYSIFPNLT